MRLIYNVLAGVSMKGECNVILLNAISHDVIVDSKTLQK